MKEELPNIISKFQGKRICSLNKNSTSQFKFFLAWLFLFLGITETFAGPRDFLQAQKIAQQKAATLGASINEQNIQQARARSRGGVTPQQTTPYYIFNFNDSTGYAIVGGDDRMPAIVGYSDKGTLNPDSLPVNLKSFLAAYKATVESVEKGDTAAVKNVKAAMKREAGSYTPIAPLLGGIEWSQNAPFNNLCPKYEGENRSVTGCAATAMAQIMRYWKWPPTLQNDIPGYKWRGLQLETIPKGFVYDWENMLDTIYRYGQYTDAQATAVAALMLHTGISIGSMYTADGTAALENNVPDALTTYFGYDNQTICYLYRPNFEWDDWNKILQKELFLKRPIFYGGGNENNTTAHAFICDGIDSDGYYHINWGWQSANGYFDITILNPHYDKSHKDEFQNDGFCYDNTAIIGIQPADGQEHEPAFSFDRLYVSYSGVSFDETYRKNSTDPFYGSYISESIYPKTTFNTPTIWLAIGEKDENGNFVKISEKSAKINTQNMPSVVSVNIPICHAFTKGTHRLVLIQSTDDEKTWQACYGNGRQVEVYVTEHEIFDNNSRYKKMEAEGFNFQVDRMEHYASVIKGNNLENVVIPEFVNYDGVDYPVQLISTNCFVYCDKIERIFIPKSVESLGRIIDDKSYIYGGCFEGCTNLREVIFEKGTKLKTIGGYCFQGCKSLKSIEVPDGVEILSAKAFSNCSSLTSVSLPNTLKKMDSHCFNSCSSLTNIMLPEGTEVLGTYCFADCEALESINLPSTLREIESSCFSGCLKLQGKLVVPEGVEKLGDGCFFRTSFTSLSLPSTLREIGDNCFYGCSKLQGNLAIPKGVERLGDYSFAFTSITSISLPNTIREIGDKCFQGCDKLVENQNGKLVFPERIERLGNGSFKGCHSLKYIVLPNALREIGDQCFMWCDIRSLDFTNCKNLKSIGASAFSDCQYITDILIPEGVEKVGSWCFYGIGFLRKISFPSTLTEIGDSLFHGTFPENFKDIYLYVKEVPHNFQNSFARWSPDEAWPEGYNSLSDCTLHVPKESLEDYKKVATLFKTVVPLTDDETGINQPLLENIRISVTENGIILKGVPQGTPISIYTLGGNMICQKTSGGNTVSFSTSEPMVIAKIGNKSIKIATNKTL